MIGSLPRQRVDELMDSPAIAPDEHVRALRGLLRINRISRTARCFLPEVLRIARKLGRKRLTLLDVACGGGDVPLHLRALAQRHGVELQLILADRSALALEHARRQAGDIPVQAIVCEALSESLPRCDVVTSSLFLHHLDRDDAVHVIRHLASRATHALVMSDLVRSPAGFLVAWAGCHLLSSSPVVRHDGPASVRAAWTVREMRDMCRSAGLSDARIRSTWPWRMLITWRR